MNKKILYAIVLVAIVVNILIYILNNNNVIHSQNYTINLSDNIATELNNDSYLSSILYDYKDYNIDTLFFNYIGGLSNIQKLDSDSVYISTNKAASSLIVFKVINDSLHLVHEKFLKGKGDGEVLNMINMYHFDGTIYINDIINKKISSFSYNSNYEIFHKNDYEGKRVFKSINNNDKFYFLSNDGSLLTSNSIENNNKATLIAKLFDAFDPFTYHDGVLLNDGAYVNYLSYYLPLRIKLRDSKLEIYPILPFEKLHDLKIERKTLENGDTFEYPSPDNKLLNYDFKISNNYFFVLRKYNDNKNQLLFSEKDNFKSSINRIIIDKYYTNIVKDSISNQIIIYDSDNYYSHLLVITL